MEQWLKHPFTLGLASGLAVALLAWISGLINRRHLRRDLRDLKKHLNMQMSITTKGQEGLQKELETLKKQNENLRVSLAGLQQKPGRAELRTLQVYDRALSLMHRRAPGFAPVWQEVLGESEGEMAKNEGGLGKLLKKVFNPGQLAEPSPGPGAAGSDNASASDPAMLDGDEAKEKR